MLKVFTSKDKNLLLLRCCRFPNELDPHLDKLYALLKSDKNDVKKITLMVLTHLILNDMIKVRLNYSYISYNFQCTQSTPEKGGIP